MTYDPDNIFAKILRGEIPSTTVYEDHSVVAFRDINPQAPTHILIIPRAERATLADCTEEDEALLGHMQIVANRIAREEGLESWRTVINCGAGAGQEVFHLHLHLLGGRPFAWPPG